MRFYTLVVLEAVEETAMLLLLSFPERRDSLRLPYS
jgi:hypothetical protein